MRGGGGIRSPERRPRPRLRCLLFAPANHERHASKALASSADAAILDLEDAVLADGKQAAREAAERLLAGRDAARPLAFVRINGMGTAHAYRDLQAVVGGRLSAVVVPKVESPQELVALHWLLEQLERERDLKPGSIAILPIVETARGLAAATEIARASPRVWTLNFGVADFSLDTGMRPSRGHPGVALAKTMIVLACRVAEVDAPIDTARLDLDDEAGLAAEASDAFRLGFQGKACIHPQQLDVVRAAFSADPAEVAQARDIIAAFDEAAAAGRAYLRVGSGFVDYPVVERARRLVDADLGATTDAHGGGEPAVGDGTTGGAGPGPG